MAKEDKVQLPTYEELLNSSDLNDAQSVMLKVYESYKLKNPKKFEAKKAEFAKKIINLKTI